MNEEEKRLVKEVLHEVGNDEQPNHVPFFNKYVIPGLSVIMILLLASYFVIGPVHSTIRGQIASSALKNNEYSFGEYLLVFYNDTASELESIYTEFQQEKLVETSVCLKGVVYNKTYGITEIFYPQIFSATFTNVNFAPCPKGTIVMLHTHPYKSCLASDQDIETFESSKERLDNLLMLVMCEERRYTLYD